PRRLVGPLTRAFRTPRTRSILRVRRSERAELSTKPRSPEPGLAPDGLAGRESAEAALAEAAIMAIELAVPTRDSWRAALCTLSFRANAGLIYWPRGERFCGPGSPGPRA